MITRKTFEFECTECRKVFDIKLNVAYNGNYRVHCPNCDHVHYREVKDGEVTLIRFNDDTHKNDRLLYDDILPMKSSCRDFLKETKKDNAHSGIGIMRRSLIERFATI